MTKHRLVLSLGLMVLFILIGLAGNRFLASLRRDPPRTEAGPEPVPVVQTMPLVPTEEPLVIRGYGIVRPVVTVALPTEVTGTLADRHPDLETGRTIAAGQTLFQIDNEPFHIRRDRAQAQLDQARAQLQAIEQEIKGLERSVNVTARALELAERETARFEKLVADQATSRSQVDRVQTTQQAALATLVRDENALVQARARRSTQDTLITQARASLEEAELQLRKTVITAPFPARVIRRLAERGEYVVAGKTLVELYDAERLEVAVPVAVSDLAWLPPIGASGGNSLSQAGGAEVALCLSGISQQRFCWLGVIDRLGGVVDERTRTVDVVVRLTSQTKAADQGRAGDVPVPLIKGLFVEVDLIGAPIPGVYRVPRRTVTNDNRLHVARNGKVARVPVTPLRLVDGDAYVRGTFEPGDLLILTSLATAVEGQEVRLMAAEAGR
jgi:membrane fusion protein, multidrug efflux system